MREQIKESLEDKNQNIMTAMIDIVFLLLIFFMCATRFKQVENKLNVFLPNEGQVNTTPQQTKPEEIVIFVKDDSTARRSTDFQTRATRSATYFLGSRESSPFTHATQMSERLRQLARSSPDQRVLIRLFDPSRGDEKVPFFNIVAAVDVCKAAGIEQVRFEAPHQP